MRLKWAFWDILGQLGTFWDFWDNSEDFLTSLEHLDCLPSHFGPFSSITGSFKRTRSRPTDGRTTWSPTRSHVPTRNLHSTPSSTASISRQTLNKSCQFKQQRQPQTTSQATRQLHPQRFMQILRVEPQVARQTRPRAELLLQQKRPPPQPTYTAS